MLTRPRLREFLSALEGRLERPARLFLVGESALVTAGLQEWTDRLVYTADAEEPARSMDELDRWLAEVLPRFSVARLQQDPAEFRRKFKALRQMWRALPGRSPDRVP